MVFLDSALQSQLYGTVLGYIPLVHSADKGHQFFFCGCQCVEVEVVAVDSLTASLAAFLKSSISTKFCKPDSASCVWKKEDFRDVYRMIWSRRQTTSNWLTLRLASSLPVPLTLTTMFCFMSCSRTASMTPSATTLCRVGEEGAR